MNDVIAEEKAIADKKAVIAKGRARKRERDEDEMRKALTGKVEKRKTVPRIRVKARLGMIPKRK